MKRNHTIVTASKIGLLGLGLTFAASSSLLAQSFSGDFSSYGENADLTEDGWIFKSGFESNTAIVQDAGTHATVTAFGNTISRNARLSPDPFLALAVSDTENNRLMFDIRWTTPGTTGVLTTSYFNAQGGAGAINMGFFMTGGVHSLFFDLGGSANRITSTGITVDPTAWYRFVTDFTPSSGLVEFEVLKLDGEGAGSVWLGSNVTEETASYVATTWNAIEVDVTRPGSTGQTSSDFDNIVITSIPEPTTTAFLLGAGCVALIGLRRFRAGRVRS